MVVSEYTHIGAFDGGIKDLFRKKKKKVAPVVTAVNAARPVVEKVAPGVDVPNIPGFDVPQSVVEPLTQDAPAQDATAPAQKTTFQKYLPVMIVGGATLLVVGLAAVLLGRKG